MRNLTAASVLLLFSFGKPSFGAGDSLSGHWEGVAVKDGEKLQFVVDFRTEASEIRGAMSVDSMGVFRLPLTAIRYRPPDLHFETPGDPGPGTFDGKVETGQVAGSWQFLGATGEFVLKRALPKPPPYEEQEVLFLNGNIALAGTLFLPRSRGPHSAVVFTHGSGQVNRDALGFMADFFARHGIAGLAYDKRGVGRSTGDWRVATFDDLAGDALAGVQLLKNRAEINPRQIGLWGLSQPGWVNSLAASRSKDVAFVIVVSGACTTPEYQEIKRIERTLRADDFAEDEIAEAVELMKLKFTFARNGMAWSKYKAAVEKAREKGWFDRGGRESGFLAAPISKQDWSWRFWRQINDFNPIPVWRRVLCPVLAIYGELDTVTPVPESVRNLRQALKDGGNKDYTIKIFPRADHGIYVLPKAGEPWHWPRFAEGYLELMVEWLQQRLPSRTSAPKITSLHLAGSGLLVFPSPDR